MKHSIKLIDVHWKDSVETYAYVPGMSGLSPADDESGRLKEAMIAKSVDKKKTESAKRQLAHLVAHANLAMHYPDESLVLRCPPIGFPLGLSEPSEYIY